VINADGMAEAGMVSGEFKAGLVVVRDYANENLVRVGRLGRYTRRGCCQVSHDTYSGRIDQRDIRVV